MWFVRIDIAFKLHVRIALYPTAKELTVFKPHIYTCDFVLALATRDPHSELLCDKIRGRLALAASGSG